jgi:hypothetical protein
MTFVAVLLAASVGYASSYVQGWVGKPAPKSLVNASCNTSTAPVLKPRNVTINVYNATTRVGLAVSATNAMLTQGFNVISTGNDPLGKRLSIVAELRHGEGGMDSARLLALRLPGAKLVLDNRVDATVDVVLGKKYRGVKVPPKGAGVLKLKKAGC